MTNIDDVIKLIRDKDNFESNLIDSINTACLKAARGDRKRRKQLLEQVHHYFVDEQVQRAVKAAFAGDYDIAAKHTAWAADHRGFQLYDQKRKLSPKGYERILSVALQNTKLEYFLREAQTFARRDRKRMMTAEERVNRTKQYVDLCERAMELRYDHNNTHTIIKRKLYGAMFKAYNLALRDHLKESTDIATEGGKQQLVRLHRKMQKVTALVNSAGFELYNATLTSAGRKKVYEKLDPVYRALMTCMKDGTLLTADQQRLFDVRI
jgi:predicted glycosyl hydrolase (DUF1957 family)